MYIFLSIKLILFLTLSPPPSLSLISMPLHACINLCCLNAIFFFSFQKHALGKMQAYPPLVGTWKAAS